MPPVIEIGPDDRVLAVLPFFHIYGMTVLLNLALRQRATLVTMPRFDLMEFLRVIQDHRCTFLFIAPPIAVALAKHPAVEQFDLSSVHSVFSAPRPSTARRPRRRADGSEPALPGYGMSELSPVSHAIPAEGGMPVSSVGVLIPNCEAKIVDPETGDEPRSTATTGSPLPERSGCADPTSCWAT